jgi:hypothetical protein
VEGDIWYGRAIRGRALVLKPTGAPYIAEIEGNWESFNAGSVDVADIIPQKKTITAIKVLTVTRDEVRTVDTLEIQDFEMLEYDTVYDLKNGNKVNEVILFGQGGRRTGLVEPHPTERHYGRRVETRTCWLGFVGCGD